MRVSDPPLADLLRSAIPSSLRLCVTFASSAFSPLFEPFAIFAFTPAHHPKCAHKTVAERAHALNPRGLDPSGEFVLWPYITYKAGFIFFWACILGVITQYFLNMEIERWTLATGESAITGFCRINRNWAWVFLILNILPWAWPGWATGAGQMLSWALFGAEEVIDPKTGVVRGAGDPRVGRRVGVLAPLR